MLPWLAAGAIAVGKAVYEWSKTRNGKLVIGGAEMAAGAYAAKKAKSKLPVDPNGAKHGQHVANEGAKKVGEALGETWQSHHRPPTPPSGPIRPN